MRLAGRRVHVERAQRVLSSAPPPPRCSNRPAASLGTEVQEQWGRHPVPTPAESRRPGSLGAQVACVKVLRVHKTFACSARCLGFESTARSEKKRERATKREDVVVGALCVSNAHAHAPKGQGKKKGEGLHTLFQRAPRRSGFCAARPPDTHTVV